MATPIGETLLVTRPEEFRRWLRGNSARKHEIWLVQFKRATGKACLDYGKAVEQAICFGWIDSSIRSIDSERYVIRFTPRRPGSHWTEANKRLAKRLKADGRMTAAGERALAPNPRALKRSSRGRPSKA